MKELLEAAVAGKAHEWGIIPVTELVFSPELFKTCATNVCGHYNTSWTCPPAAGSLEEQRAKILSYKNAFVFTTKYDLEDSFDYEGMAMARSLLRLPVESGPIFQWFCLISVLSESKAKMTTFVHDHVAADGAA